jgi:predicted choloylglycine hydrolase
MENGRVILLVIALLFLCMYVYAYGTTYYAIKKEEWTKRRKLLAAQEKELRIKAEMQERQNQREEQYRIANARSLQIQQELKQLGKLKQQKVQA